MPSRRDSRANGEEGRGEQGSCHQRLAVKHFRSNSRSKHSDGQQPGGDGKRKAALCRSDLENGSQNRHERLNAIDESKRAERGRNHSYVDPPKSSGARLNVPGFSDRLRLRGWLQFNLTMER